MSGRSKTHYSGALNQPIVLPLGRVEELERRLPKGFDPNSK
jgi:hypothetical protein